MATVKRAPKAVSSKIKFNEEAIRVVPIYHPKLNVPLKEIINKKKDAKFFKPATTTATPPKLIYNGGPLIKNVKVYTIFWGTNWSSVAAFVSLKNDINNFFTAILASPLIDQLSEYSVTGQAIGHGSLIGTKIISAAAPTKSISDSKIQSTLTGWLNAGTLPAWNGNTLYFIYLDKGVKVTMGGSASCTSFCGYHNAISNKNYYAVMPFPGCAGCLGGQTVLDALTGTSSHELCEAITDPVPPTGWYDNANGEIGDICAWKFKTVAGRNVQLEWSNKAKKCV